MHAHRPTTGLIAVLAALLAIGAVVGPTTVSAADGPTVSMGDQVGLERDTAIGSVFMPVTLSEPVAEPVVVNYYTENGTAVYIAPEDRDDPLVFGDYQRRGIWPPDPIYGGTRSVTIPAGAVQTWINIPVNIDDEVEPDETFFVVIQSVSGGNATIGDDTGTATIVDADSVSAANPAINVSSGAVYEGDSGSRRAQFLVQLSRAPSTNITFTYTTQNDTAVSPDDYKAKLPGAVTFAPGQISKTIDVIVEPNAAQDGARSFELDVSVTGGSPVEELNMTGTMTILDDDSPVAAPCPPGFFNAETGNEPCAPAPPGTFVDTEGATSATPCDPGTFQDQQGQTSCQLAPVGFYVDQLGATSATACPPGTTTDGPGATSLADCVAPPVVPQVAGGNNHTCALRADGVVRCWGDNSLGQLGDGTTTSSNTPVTVTGLPTDIVAIASGDAQSCALTSGGAVKCWGNNADGQLGDGTQTQREAPVDVVGLGSGVSAIGAGDNHTCAGLAAGGVKCWGWASSGQLGNGTLIGRSLVPIDVQGLPAGAVAVEISAGFAHTCATLDDTSTWCWGRNSSGQLGTGGNEARVLSAVQPTGLDAGTTAVVGGGAHTCVVQLTGVKCTGLNNSGQLGNGTTTESNTPVTVTGLSGIAAVAAGGSHSCALSTAGAVSCWGLNQDGQLGIDQPTTNNVTTPVPVVGLGSGQSSLSAGVAHTCAMASDGSIRCWGANGTGQLGDGTTSQADAPVTVTGL